MNTEIYFYKTNIDVEFYQEFEEPEIFVFRIDQDTYVGSFNKNISILRNIIHNYYTRLRVLSQE